MARSKTSKKVKETSVNFLEMVPKRKARWRRVTKEALERVARVEDIGLVHKGCEVRQDYITTAKVVVYGKKKMGKVQKKVAEMFGRDDEARVWLDDYGGEVWLLMDGKRNVDAIGKEMKKTFGDKAEPLYERLNHFMNTLIEVNLIELEASKKNQPAKGSAGAKKSSTKGSVGTKKKPSNGSAGTKK